MSNRTFHSVLWTGVERFGAQVFQAIFAIILARLLMPEDYGLVAMIFVFFTVGLILMDGGLSLALLQKKNPTEHDFSTVFWFNLGFGIVLYAVLFFCAPLIARFYDQPILIPIVKIAGLNIVVWALSIIHSTKLDIALNFKRQAFITILAMIISGFLGIWLAFSGYGVWALVFQFLSHNLLRTSLLWIFGIRWYPKFIFSVTAFKSLFNFGSKFMLTNLLDTVYKNMFLVFIGRFYALKELGFFQKANTLTNLLTTQISYTVGRSFIPLQTSLSDNPDGQRHSFNRFLSLKCFIVFPLAILFAVLAEPFVAFVLTERWLPAVPFIQILCLSYIWYPILVVNRNMLLSKGFSKQNLMIDLIAKTFGIIAFLMALPHGIGWICVSIGFYAFVDMVVSMFFAKKYLSIRLIEQLKIIAPTFGLAVVSGIVAWLVMNGVTYYFPENDFMKLVFGGVSGLGIYALGAHVLKFDEWKFMLNYLKEKRRG
ncbi:MAG: lipopolysaccharide biosynthesis protein [Bacteroidales bacterium]|nr:lipopolysaccharide biosynthesis protein [Bacteroidales bacterium]